MKIGMSRIILNSQYVKGQGQIFVVDNFQYCLGFIYIYISTCLLVQVLSFIRGMTRVKMLKYYNT